jgi:sulfatase maturation enzyme AslB (radical SAM superfamily)
MKKHPENFCRLPWVGFSNDPNGTVRACCIYKDTVKDDDGNEMWVQKHSLEEIFHSNYMKDLRDKFRRNEKPEGCSVCWNDESNGYKSKRLNYLESTIDDFKEINWEKEPGMPYDFQMIISNGCNLKCRSCYSSHSTQWQNEHIRRFGHKTYEMPHGQSGDEEGVLWKDRHKWYKNLKKLEIVGGEPFFIKQWYQIWDELIELGYSKNINLVASTNCTAIYPETIRKLWNNFNGIGMALSIDGLGKQYEYLRHPGNWETTKKNLLMYNELQKESIYSLSCNVTTTVGWQNAWYLPEIHEFFKNETDFGVWNNIIYVPQHMTLWGCPDELKDAIVEKWDSYNWNPDTKRDIDAMKKFMYSKSMTTEEFMSSLKELKVVDELRKENFMNSFPEISEYIKPYWEKLF